MGASEIIDQIARERRVERIACNIAKSELSQNLQDLCQMVYIILLEYPEPVIIDLWEKKQINFFIARIVMRQYQGNHSEYYYTIRKFSSETDDITESYGEATDD